jgi:hypothetical protein
VIKQKDNKPQVLFYNEMPDIKPEHVEGTFSSVRRYSEKRLDNPELGVDIKELWHKMRLPSNDEDLQKELTQGKSRCLSLPCDSDFV